MAEKYNRTSFEELLGWLQLPPTLCCVQMSLRSCCLAQSWSCSPCPVQRARFFLISQEKGSCGTPLEFSPGPIRRGCRGRRNPTAACCSPTCIILGRRQPHFPGSPLPEAFDQGTAPCVLLRAEPTFPVTLPSLHGWRSVCIRAPHPRGFMFPLCCSFWFRKALCWGCLKIWRRRRGTFSGRALQPASITSKPARGHVILTDVVHYRSGYCTDVSHGIAPTLLLVCQGYISKYNIAEKQKEAAD